MGAVFEIVAYHAIPAHASQAMARAFQEIDRLEQVMSAYKPDSELSRLNRRGDLRPQTVSSDLYRVIEESLYYARLSGGAFDITTGRLAARWKGVGDGEPVPGPAESKRLQRGVGYGRVELMPPNRIRFHTSRLDLDLGAIGKGYAVDRAGAVLRSCGIERLLINAGGSTFRAWGSPSGQDGWLVHLRDPSARLGPSVRLQQNSVSTSEQPPPSLLGMSSFGHIIDPAAGLPPKTAVAVSVVAETATASDALSTALLLLGPAKGRVVMKQLPNVAAIWVGPEGLVGSLSTEVEIMLNPAQAAVRNPA